MLAAKFTNPLLIDLVTKYETDVLATTLIAVTVPMAGVCVAD